MLRRLADELPSVLEVPRGVKVDDEAELRIDLRDVVLGDFQRVNLIVEVPDPQISARRDLSRMGQASLRIYRVQGLEVRPDSGDNNVMLVHEPKHVAYDPLIKKRHVAGHDKCPGGLAHGKCREEPAHGPATGQDVGEHGEPEKGKELRRVGNDVDFAEHAEEDVGRSFNNCASSQLEKGFVPSTHPSGLASGKERSGDPCFPAGQHPLTDFTHRRYFVRPRPVREPGESYRAPSGAGVSEGGTDLGRSDSWRSGVFICWVSVRARLANRS